MELWAITLSKDERTVLSVGLDPSVTTPLMDALVGQFLVLFPNKASALLYARAVVQSGYFEPGEYTVYEVTGLPVDSYSQEIRVTFDDPKLGETHTVAVNPPEVPASLIRFSERRMIVAE